MKTTKVLKSTDERWLSEAMKALEMGHLVAFPTDTVYGLGCDAFNALAIERLYQCKGRGTEKAIPILVASLEQVSKVSPTSKDNYENIGRAFWPGPLTIIVDKDPSIPATVSSTDTLGVRIPDHPIALELLEAWGPMAVSSANLSGDHSTREAGEVLAQLDGRFDLLIDGGRSPGGSPSTVVDFRARPINILRQGPITMEQLLSSLQGDF